MTGAPLIEVPPQRLTGNGLVVLMCMAQAFGLLGFAVLPALLPQLIDVWMLGESEAGWLGALFFAGYMAAVPLLLPLTDRVDARSVFLVCSLLVWLAMTGFAVLAQGFWSAALLRFALGVGFAGCYMPGLKVLTDRLKAKDPSRGIAFYTSSYLIGAAASYDLAGRINAWLDWHWAFALTGLGSFGAMLLVFAGTAPMPPPQVPGRTWLPDFRPVLRNREALGYMFAYAMHNWELFAYSAWSVTWLTHAASLQPDGAQGWNLTLLGSVVTLAALPASILGNELALRIGRQRTVVVAMWVSGALGVAVGQLGHLPFIAVVALAVLYGLTTTAESATVTAGTIMAASPETRGAAMAMHSFIGFGGAFAGPLLFGTVLEALGGRGVTEAWGGAFAVGAIGAVLGPIGLLWLTRSRRGRSDSAK